MTVESGLPMIVEEDTGVADWLIAVHRSVVEDSLMFSLVIRVRFVYELRLIWNLSTNRYKVPDFTKFSG